MQNDLALYQPNQPALRNLPAVQSSVQIQTVDPVTEEHQVTLQTQDLLLQIQKTCDAMLVEMHQQAVSLKKTSQSSENLYTETQRQNKKVNKDAADAKKGRSFGKESVWSNDAAVLASAKQGKQLASNPLAFVDIFGPALIRSFDSGIRTMASSLGNKLFPKKPKESEKEKTGLNKPESSGPSNPTAVTMAGFSSLTDNIQDLRDSIHSDIVIATNDLKDSILSSFGDLNHKLTESFTLLLAFLQDGEFPIMSTSETEHYSLPAPEGSVPIEEVIEELEPASEEEIAAQEKLQSKNDATALLEQADAVGGLPVSEGPMATLELMGIIAAVTIIAGLLNKVYRSISDFLSLWKKKNDIREKEGEILEAAYDPKVTAGSVTTGQLHALPASFYEGVDSTGQTHEQFMEGLTGGLDGKQYVTAADFTGDMMVSALDRASELSPEALLANNNITLTEDAFERALKATGKEGSLTYEQYLKARHKYYGDYKEYLKKYKARGGIVAVKAGKDWGSLDEKTAEKFAKASRNDRDFTHTFLDPLAQELTQRNTVSNLRQLDDNVLLNNILAGQEGIYSTLDIAQAAMDENGNFTYNPFTAKGDLRDNEAQAMTSTIAAWEEYLTRTDKMSEQDRKRALAQLPDVQMSEQMRDAFGFTSTSFKQSMIEHHTTVVNNNNSIPATDNTTGGSK